MYIKEGYIHTRSQSQNQHSHHLVKNITSIRLSGWGSDSDSGDEAKKVIKRVCV